MELRRREFLRSSFALAALGLAGRLPAFPQEPEDPKKLALLILGGTGFLGPEVVKAALARGHTMTLFNRGKTNPHLFPELEKLHGDRRNDLEALKGRRFDAVIDTSGYVPRHVQASAELLRDAVSHYVFVSSVSVYPDMDSKDTSEATPVGRLEDPTTEKVTETTYGPLKALCEEAAEKAMPGRTTSIRPGLIVGPNDPTDRFTYWPARVARGGEVLAPGDPRTTVQFIDVRDLGAWIVHVIERKTFGTFNALGPKSPLPTGELLAACKAAADSDASLTWIPKSFLEEQGVRPWMDMPLWIPPPAGSERAPVCANGKAFAAGLTFRPVLDTCKDTLLWHRSRGEAYQLRAGIRPERERAVLAAWHEHRKG